MTQHLLSPWHAPSEPGALAAQTSCNLIELGTCHWQAVDAAVTWPSKQLEPDHYRGLWHAGIRAHDRGPSMPAIQSDKVT